MAVAVLLAACGEPDGAAGEDGTAVQVDSDHPAPPETLVTFPAGRSLEGNRSLLNVDMGLDGSVREAVFDLGARSPHLDFKWEIFIPVDLPDLLEDGHLLFALAPIQPTVNMVGTGQVGMVTPEGEIGSTAGVLEIQIADAVAVGTVEAEPEALTARFESKISITCSVEGGNAAFSGSVARFESPQCAPLNALLGNAVF